LKIKSGLDRSPGFSRIRLSIHYLATPAGIPPAEAGTPDFSYPDYLLNILQPFQAFPAVGHSPGKHLPAKAGTPDYSYPDYLLNVHQSGFLDDISGLFAQRSSTRFYRTSPQKNACHRGNAAASDGW
jgi:hypothetical protein